MKWVYSNNIKKQQRKLNKLVKHLNQNIQQDNLWQGRFFIRQVSRNVEKFDDGSGSLLCLTFRFVDKLDCVYQDYYGTSAEWAGVFGNGLGFWWMMNKFITEESSAWKVNDPRNTSINCNLILEDSTLRTATPLSYVKHIQY